MRKAKVGEIVHWNYPIGGAHRPALVLTCYGPDCVDLIAFLKPGESPDGTLTLYIPRAFQDVRADNTTPSTWHFMDEDPQDELRI